MLAKVLLVSLFAALVGADSRLKTLLGNDRLMMDKNQELQVSLQLQAMEVQHFLSSLPAQCALSHYDKVQAAQVAALRKFSRCRRKVYFKNIGEIFVETGAYALIVYDYGSNAVAEVTACIDHAGWLRCALSAPARIFEDVKFIVSEVRDFYTQVKSLIPDILAGTRQCLYESSSDYQNTLDEIVQVAKTCLFNFDH